MNNFTDSYAVIIIALAGTAVAIRRLKPEAKIKIDHIIKGCDNTYELFIYYDNIIHIFNHVIK